MFSAMNRIIYPDETISSEAGKTIQKMGVKSKDILGDTIIAMSAKSIGATVWTMNKDFDKIRDVKEFKLKIFEPQ
jgi:predicted nucleic acid-binding protein